MNVRAVICIWVAALAVLLTSPAAAERRVALVIGNGAYAKVPKLANPLNDAGAMEALFKAAGFEKVVRADNLNAAQMRRAIRDFSDETRDADIAVVFYAGHGLELNGTNYLIPVDAALERDMDVADEAIALERVNLALESAKRLRLIILDACRDNPFMRTMLRTLAGRSIGRGLAPVEVTTTETLIAYAAKAGSTAADGESANSPYTAALIKHLITPGLDVRLALGRVRDEVLRATNRRQEPFVYGSLGGAEVPLVAAPRTPNIPAPADAGTTTVSAAAEAWDRIKETRDAAVLEVFIARFGDTFFGDLAKARLAALREEQRRLALLQQQKEDQSRAEAAAAEARRKAEEEKRQKKAADDPFQAARAEVARAGVTFGLGALERAIDHPLLVSAPSGRSVQYVVDYVYFGTRYTKSVRLTPVAPGLVIRSESTAKSNGSKVSEEKMLDYFNGLLSAASSRKDIVGNRWVAAHSEVTAIKAVKGTIFPVSEKSFDLSATQRDSIKTVTSIYNCQIRAPVEGRSLNAAVIGKAFPVTCRIPKSFAGTNDTLAFHFLEDYGVFIDVGSSPNMSTTLRSFSIIE